MGVVDPPLVHPPIRWRVSALVVDRLEPQTSGLGLTQPLSCLQSPFLLNLQRAPNDPSGRVIGPMAEVARGLLKVKRK